MKTIFTSVLVLVSLSFSSCLLPNTSSMARTKISRKRTASAPNIASTTKRRLTMREESDGGSDIEETAAVAPTTPSRLSNAKSLVSGMSPGSLEALLAAAQQEQAAAAASTTTQEQASTTTTTQENVSLVTDSSGSNDDSASHKDAADINDLVDARVSMRDANGELLEQFGGGMDKSILYKCALSPDYEKKRSSILGKVRSLFFIIFLIEFVLSRCSFFSWLMRSKSPIFPIWRWRPFTIKTLHAVDSLSSII